jgi:hypothetical protein
MKFEPDHSVERIQRLVESEVWNEFCVDNKIGQNKIICLNCYSANSLFQVSKTIYMCKSCNADAPKTEYLRIPLEHQHRAILKELGYFIETFTYITTGEHCVHVYNEKRPAVLDIDFTAPTVEQALDMAVLWALENKESDQCQTK